MTSSDRNNEPAPTGYAKEILPEGRVRALLTGVPIPEDGLVLTSVYANTTTDLTAGVRFRLVADVETRLADLPPLHLSTNNSDHHIGVWPYADGYWVTRHEETSEGIYECRLFEDPTSAFHFYSDVVRGQQDATSGQAWEVTDVPGLLAGDDFRLAQRIGLSYWEAHTQYADDPHGCRVFWEIIGPPPAV